MEFQVAGNDISKKYDNECYNRSTAHGSNMCFDEIMKLWSYPQGRRKFSNICLLPEIGVPMQHHSHMKLNAGAFIWHKKGLSLERMQSSGYFFYNKTSDRQYLRNENFVKEYGFNKKNIYVLINNTKHRIPDFNTFLNLEKIYRMSNLMSQTVIMASADFNQIEEGKVLERLV